jgi:hypothetical protein
MTDDTCKYRRTGKVLLVDGHVHFHNCFSWKNFLNAAVANFAQARQQLQIPDNSPGCLLLTESAGVNQYRVLLSQPEIVESLGWRIIESGEKCSVILSRGEDTLILIAGRQIVTAENLELLAIGCGRGPADGSPIRHALRSIGEAGAVPILPWGFGKWLGQRARTVRDLLFSNDLPRFHLGDNGGRLRMVPPPALFEQARKKGIAILPGSDPLDVPAHVRRPGSYGFVLGSWDKTLAPAEEIKTRIRSLQQSPPTFGAASSLFDGLASQLSVRWRKLIKLR